MSYKYLFIREEMYGNKLHDKFIFNTKEELLDYLIKNWKWIFNNGFSSSRIILERLKVKEDE